MHSYAALSIAALALASGVQASTFQYQNSCPGSTYLTIVTPGQNQNGPTEVKSGSVVSFPLSGSGVSVGVTNNADYYSPNTGKLILGYTNTGGTVYWSVSDVNGDPFSGKSFSVTSPDASGANKCDTANSADGKTHGCPDGNFTLKLQGCS